MFFPYFLWQPQGEPAPEPAPVGWVDATPQVHVRAYALQDGQVVREWTGWGSLDIPFDMRGPLGTNLVAPQGSGHAHHRYLRPGGDAALIEVDARGVGVPDVLLGQAGSFKVSLAEGSVAVEIPNPETWLAEITLHDVPPARSNAGQVLSRAIASHTANHRLELGYIEAGPAIEAELAGLSLWDMFGHVEDRSGLELRLTALAGKARLAVHLRDPLSAPDARRKVTLIESENCSEVEFGGSLPTNAREAVGVALAAVQGTGPASAGIRMPSGPVVGRRAALAATMYNQVAGHLVGGPTILSSATPGADMLAAELATFARRHIAPTVGGSAAITDPRLYEYMRPGTIVSANFRGDPTGYFERSLVQIRTVTWTVQEGAGGAPAKVTQCRISFELWAVGS